MQEFNDYKILIVEDDEDSRGILLDFIASLGFRPLGVIDGKVAFDKVKMLVPDIIFLDIMMPRLDGFSFVEKVIENELSTNIVITTALNDLSSVRKAKSLGVYEYVAKPFHLEMIKEKLAKILSVPIDITKIDPYELKYFVEENYEGYEYVHISGNLDDKGIAQLEKEFPELYEKYHLEEAKFIYDLRDVNNHSYNTKNIEKFVKLIYSLGLQQVSDIVIICLEPKIIDLFLEDKKGKHLKIVKTKEEAVKELFYSSN